MESSKWYDNAKGRSPDEHKKRSLRKSFGIYASKKNDGESTSDKRRNSDKIDKTSASKKWFEDDLVFLKDTVRRSASDASNSYIESFFRGRKSTGDESSIASSPSSSFRNRLKSIGHKSLPRDAGMLRKKKEGSFKQNNGDVEVATEYEEEGRSGGGPNVRRFLGPQTGSAPSSPNLGGEGCARVHSPTGKLSTFIPKIRKTKSNLKLDNSPKDNKRNERRVECFLSLWIQEAKDVPRKKRYFCRIYLDATAKFRTTTKSMKQMCFWGESFKETTPSKTASLHIQLFRESDRKEKLIGTTDEINLTASSNSACTEQWYQIHCEKQEKMKPSLRIKFSFQAVDILPLENYSDLRQHIRENAVTLCKTLEPGLPLRLKEDLGTCLVAILHEDNQVVQFLVQLILQEVEKNSCDEHLLLRGNSIATKSIDAYMKLVGDKYLQQTLGSCVRDLLTSCKDLEVDPLKIASIGALPSNQAELEDEIYRVWRNILNSVEVFPAELRKVFSTLRKELKERKNECVFDKLLSSCVFLRFLCPAILYPSLFKLTKVFPDEVAARSLTLIAKTLQTLANFTRFQGKESYMEFLNHFIDKEQLNCHWFLNEISNSDPTLSAILNDISTQLKTDRCDGFYRMSRNSIGRKSVETPLSDVLNQISSVSVSSPFRRRSAMEEKNNNINFSRSSLQDDSTFDENNQNTMSIEKQSSIQKEQMPNEFCPLIDNKKEGPRYANLINSSRLLSSNSQEFNLLHSISRALGDDTEGLHSWCNSIIEESAGLTSSPARLNASSAHAQANSAHISTSRATVISRQSAEESSPQGVLSSDAKNNNIPLGHQEESLEAMTPNSNKWEDGARPVLSSTAFNKRTKRPVCDPSMREFNKFMDSLSDHMKSFCHKRDAKGGGFARRDFGNSSFYGSTMDQKQSLIGSSPRLTRTQKSFGETDCRKLGIQFKNNLSTKSSFYLPSHSSGRLSPVKSKIAQCQNNFREDSSSYSSQDLLQAKETELKELMDSLQEFEKHHFEEIAKEV